MLLCHVCMFLCVFVSARACEPERKKKKISPGSNSPPSSHCGFHPPFSVSQVSLRVCVVCVLLNVFVRASLCTCVNRFLSELAPLCVAVCTCLRCVCVFMEVCVFCVNVCVRALITHTFEDAPAPLLVLTAVAVETVSATLSLLNDHLTM